MRGNIKPRTPSEVCGDCGAADPGWASINRGVLLCNECCSVHRSLGRHVSQIRSLQNGGHWPTSLFEMFHALVTSGSNSIWEHSLLDPLNVRSGKRKPAPNEPLHPGKSEFIRAKYQRLDFVHRLKDEDFNEQLHSSVRTGNLETCLRLLSLGAQANFFSEEKGNTPLHVASKEGQTLQCELLMVYGGDPGALDKNGKTPADLAREEGHYELADRLIQGQYELTDRLTFFVCNKKPDHATNIHFLIPEMADSSLERSDAAEKARKKLQALSNRLFEELAMDVYDEVDRRELDSLWSSLPMPHYIAGDRMVPFLPLNPELSSTRNQGRQKLATFSPRDFATLIIDILKEARRRQLGTTLGKQDSLDGKPPPVPPPAALNRNVEPIDEPLYDHVASDDDYADLENGKPDQKSTESGKSKRPESGGSSGSDGPVSLDEFMELKQSLAAAEQRIQNLMTMNKQLNQDNDMLQSMVNNLKKENAQLRSMQRGGDDSSRLEEDKKRGSSGSREGSRCVSMYEDRSQAKPTQAWQPDLKRASSGASDGGGSDSGKERKPKPKPKVPERKPILPGAEGDGEKRVSAAGSDYENASALPTKEKGDKSPTDTKSPSGGEESSSSHLSSTSSRGDTSPRSQSSADGEEKSPTQEEVVSATEKITRNIQKLLTVTQEGRNSRSKGASMFGQRRFIEAADEIMQSVKDMAQLFPEKPRSQHLATPLKALNASANRLKEACKKACSSKQQGSSEKIINCAYDIAKAAKQIVSHFQ